MDTLVYADLEKRSALQRAAEGGDTQAKLDLAEQLLSFAPYDVVQGYRWASAAAQDGNGKAAHLMAVATAEGLGVKQSFHSALDCLQRSAELGYRPAQRELLALAAQWQRARADDQTSDWRRVRQSVDVLAWLKAPPPQAASSAARIMVVENFAGSDMCDWLIEFARPGLQRAQTFDPDTGRGRYEAGRTNSTVAPNIAAMDMVLVFVRARIAALTRLPILGFEDAAILHYAPGEEFQPHYDFLENDTHALQSEIHGGGQRVMTFLGYLNDDYDGGDTAFPLLDWRHKGKKGDALYFYNATPDGQPDRRTLHAGTATTRGEKWLLSQWIRFRPATMR